MADILLVPCLPEVACDIAAGSIGGFCSKALDYPFDTAKVLLQTQSKDTKVKYTGTFDCIKQSVKLKGFKSLYDGILPRLIGSAAENAVCFMAYAALKKELLEYKTHNYQQQQQTKKSSSKDSPQQPPLTLSLQELSLAGAGAGAAVSFVMTPVELIKCRLQVSSQLATPLYKGSTDCFIQTARDEGLRGLYKGHVSTMCREIPGNFAWYLTYEVVCDRLVDLLNATSRDELPVRAHMTGGAAAGIVYWAAIFPVDTVKSVLQTQKHNHDGGPKPTFSSVTKSIYGEQGLRGLYRGFGVTAMRAAPANAVLFAAYEQTMQFLKPN